MKAGDDITLLLGRIESGDPQAPNELLTAVYGELRKLAASRMAHEAAGHTLQPTALVHEAWLRLGGDHQPEWKNRAHFFAAAADAMRRILVDHARRRLAQRRGGRLEHVPLEDVAVAASANDAHILAVDEAIEKFALVDQPKAELVKLRYFVGLTLPEVAEALDISLPTAERWWSYARAWLSAELRPPGN